MNQQAHVPAREKDGWDKASIIAQAAVPIVLAVLTFTYGTFEEDRKTRDAERTLILQKEQSAAARASALAEFLPFIGHEADSTQQQLVISALASLGYVDVAVKLAQLSPSQGAVRTLGVIASTADNEAVRSSAVAALHDIQLAAASMPHDTGSVQIAALADSAIVRAQASESSEVVNRWGVVTGGFRTLGQARVDADSTSARGHRAAIYLRNGVPRTVVLFTSRETASTALPSIRSEIRSTAYLVDFTRWCPTPRGRNDGVQVCGQSVEQDR